MLADEALSQATSCLVTCALSAFRGIVQAVSHDLPRLKVKTFSLHAIATDDLFELRIRRLYRVRFQHTTKLKVKAACSVNSASSLA